MESPSKAKGVQMVPIISI